MNRRSKLTVTLAVAGVVLLVIGGSLGYYLWWQGRQAEQAAAELLEQMRETSDGEDQTDASVLRIESIGLELPVLWEYSLEGLKTTVCRYQGPLPGADGNLVITGHDYLNGAHFGNLEKVEVGDEIQLFDQNGGAFIYIVYDLAVIAPDEAQELDNFQPPHTLTLMTCADNANSRLLVRCRPKTG